MSFISRNHPQQVALRGPLDEVDDRGTPQDYFDELSQRFGPFTLDVAAAPHNAKCERYYTRAIDGLSQSWSGERVWCNPPYSDLRAWVEKAWLEWDGPEPMFIKDEEGFVVDNPAFNPPPRPSGIVMLVPANRTEQPWWQDLVEPIRDRPGNQFHVEFLRGRLRFIQAGRAEIKPNERPPFGCALLIWGGR